MAVHYDLTLAELRGYRPELPAPEDFDQFWARTLAEARGFDLAPTFQPVDAGLPMIEAFDVRFCGWNGQPVAAWLLLPRGASEPLPTVIQYIGYAGGRGHVHDHLLWPAAGYAHVVMDTRGQGTSPGGAGVTADDPGPIGPHAPGFLTMGIESPERYYYRRVYTDAVRAVELAQAHPLLDPARVLLAGVSQGGGIALAAAGLTTGLLGVMPDVPFLSHFRRAIEITETLPYKELTEYCRSHRNSTENAFTTLSYFDGVHFATRASAPALFSVALMDDVCPPSTVFAAYNRWGHPDKQITVYPYNGHEGGGAYQQAEQLRFAATLSATPATAATGGSAPERSAPLREGSLN